MFLRRRKQVYNEVEAIAAAKKDQEAFGILYAHYFEQIFRFIFKQLGGKEDEAGDLTQLTFMKAMVNIQKYEDKGYPFSTWLYRIARNEVLMYYRKNKQVILELSVERMNTLLVDELHQQEEETPALEQLIEIMNSLTEEQQELIDLRYFQQISFQEIALILGSSEASIKMRTYRLLERIQQQWKGHA